MTQIPFGLSKQTVKTSVSAVISQVRTIITDVSIPDRQLQPDTECSTQKAPLQVSVLKWGPGKALLTVADRLSV